MFAVIDPVTALKGHMYVMKNFGYECSVMHILLFMNELKSKNISDVQVKEDFASRKVFNKRIFSVIALSNMESLTLSMKDIDVIKEEWPEQAAMFIKDQI